MGFGARAIIGSIAVLGILGGGWFYVNFDKHIGGIFLVLSIVGLIVALLSDQIAKFLKAPVTASSSDRLRYKTQAFIGALLGFLPIVFSLSFGLSIAVPILSVSNNLQFVATVILAPIVEEIFFLFTVPFLLGRLLEPLGFAGFIINVLVSAGVFAMYHWLAYGAVFLVSSEFAGAFIFRLLTLGMVAWLSRSTRFTVDDVAKGMLASIIMHGMFNGFVWSHKLFIASEVVA